MTEGTRLKVLDERVSSLKDHMVKVTDAVDHLSLQCNSSQAQLATLQKTIDHLSSSVTSFIASSSKPPPPPPPLPPKQPAILPTPTNTPKTFKLDFPRFNGTDPSGWLFKASQFFEFHHVPPAQRLIIASFHMDGPCSAPNTGAPLAVTRPRTVAPNRLRLTVDKNFVSLSTVVVWHRRKHQLNKLEYYIP